MRTFLIHGMGRTPLSMLLLAHRLRRAGHETHLFGYSVTFEGFEAIVDRLVNRIIKTAAGEPVDPIPQSADGKGEGVSEEDPLPSLLEESAGEAYAIVGHSLGGVLARAAWPRLPEGLERLVMLATPNHSPVIARRLAESGMLGPVFGALTGEAGQLLTEVEFFRSLPTPEVPTLVIAGEGGPRSERLPFSGAHDGIVAVEETHLEGAQHQTTDAIHSFVMNRRDVTEQILIFLTPEGPQQLEDEDAEVDELDRDSDVE